MKVEVHYKHFAPEAQDDDWIPKCVENGWTIITGDKAIETDPINRRAVEESGAKVFLTSDTNSMAEEWAAAIIVGRRKLARIVERNNGPFFVDIDKHATSHVSSVRYVGGGGPKPEEEAVMPSPPAEVSDAAVAERQPEDPQQSIAFPQAQPVADSDEDDIMIDIETQQKGDNP